MPHGTLRGVRACVLGFVMASMLMSGTVLGQGAPTSSPSANAAAAQGHFDRGLAAVQVDKWAEAREEFAAAYASSPEPKYLAALIKAEMATGRNREAAQHLTALLRMGIDANTRAQAETKLAELKAALGTAKVTVSVDGAEVLVDGVSVGRSPLEDDVFVDPGQRTFEAKKDGLATARTVMDVKAGSAPVVSLDLGKAKPLIEPWNLNKPLLYTGIGVTGALALVGITGVITNNVLYSEAEDRQREIGCSGYNDCEQQFNKLHTTRIRMNYVALGAAVGATAVGAATLIYFLGAKKQNHSTIPQAGVIIGPSGGGLVFTGRF